MSLFPLKPTHAPVKNYYAALAQFQSGHTTEGNTRSAFADILKKCASPYGWHLVEEYQFKGTAKTGVPGDRSSPSRSKPNASSPPSPPSTSQPDSPFPRRKDS